MTKRNQRARPWYVRHSPSLVAATLLLFWVAGYLWLDPKTRLSAFCGNAIADWSGSLVIILGTKFFYEVGSREGKPFRSDGANK